MKLTWLTALLIWRMHIKLVIKLHQLVPVAPHAKHAPRPPFPLQRSVTFKSFACNKTNCTLIISVSGHQKPCNGYTSNKWLINSCDGCWFDMGWPLAEEVRHGWLLLIRSLTRVYPSRHPNCVPGTWPTRSHGHGDELVTCQEHD